MAETLRSDCIKTNSANSGSLMMYSAKRIIKKLIRLVRTNPVDRLFWASRHGECPNFGDFISPYLYKEITGREPIFASPPNISIFGVYMSVGSLMSWCRENSVIWGSGIVMKGHVFPKPKAVYAIRGPLTREHFTNQGYKCPEVYGDPGLLTPLFYKNRQILRRYRIGIVPHYVDKQLANQFIPDCPDIIFIDVFGAAEKVIDDICSCETIISSSLHGIIMAHAYKIPAVWCKFRDRLWGDDVKFYDYFLSLDIDYEEPCDIRRPLTIQEEKNIEKLAITANQTKIEELQRELIKSCPYKKQSNFNLSQTLQ